MQCNDNRIVLLYPPINKKGDMRDLREDILDHLGLNLITANLRSNGYCVDYINADLLHLSLDQLIQLLRNQPEPILLGVSVLENTIEIVCELFQKLSELNYRPKIVIGGFFPTLQAIEIMQNCDYVDFIILGEGEFSMISLADALKTNTSYRQIPGLVYRDGAELRSNQQNVIDLESLPYPAQDHIPYVLERGGGGYIMTSRGCYSNCTFCSIKSFYNYCKDPWRKLDINRVVDEIEDLIVRFHQRIIPIWDDNFLSGNEGKKRALEFVKIIKQRGLKAKFFMNCRCSDINRELIETMKEIGLFQVGLGIENMSDKHLKIYGKATNTEVIKKSIKILDDLDIDIYMNFIIFNPYTTMEDLKTNFNFFTERLHKEHGYTNRNLLLPTTSVLGLMAGTKLYYELKDKPFVKKNGYHCSYTVLDKKAAAAMRVVNYLSLQWHPVYSLLMHLEHMVFEPNTSLFSVENICSECRKRYNELWGSFSQLHIDCCMSVIDALDHGTACNTAFEQFQTRLNQLIRNTNSLITTYQLDNYFLKIQYLFPPNTQGIVYDITNSEFLNISKPEADILKNYNLYNLQQIISKLSLKYGEAQALSAADKVQSLIREGHFVCSKWLLDEINGPVFLRVAKQLMQIETTQ